MKDYRFILELYKGINSRYRCPNCNKGKSFSRYIDTETGSHIADIVGRCERIDNCGYHYTPKQYFQDNNISFENRSVHVHYVNSANSVNKMNTVNRMNSVNTVNDLKHEASFIDINIFKQSLENYDANNFVKYLLSLFGLEITKQLIEKYFIGTSKHWPGATIFWQIDSAGKVRAGKIMLYNLITGKRVKEPFNHVTWTHKAFNLPEFELKQCFFGEHLLKDQTKPIAIVESEKTAILASIYLPEFIWIAAGNKTGLNVEKCKALAGRKVILFPDLNAYELWSEKAKEFSNIANFTVSDLLERKASEGEKKQGLDLADYLTRFDYKQFRQNKPIAATVNSLLTISSKDVLRDEGLTQNLLSEEFNNVTILGVIAKSGSYDLLFDRDSQLLGPGNEQLVKQIETFFEKEFKPGLLDNEPCFIHHN